MVLDYTTFATAVLWLVVITIHALSCAFYSAVAYVYLELPSTQLNEDMKSYELTIDNRFYPVIVIFHMVCSGVHLACFLEMGIQSIWHRKWYFHRTKVLKRTVPVVSANNQDVEVIKPLPNPSGSGSRKQSLLNNSFSHSASFAWRQTFGSTGFFGIHSKHFTLVFLVREVIETILQSVQALNLSYYVPRVWLNRFAVAVVTMGCWSTPLIQHFCHHDPRLELILCLLFDVTLDFASSVGVNSALAAIYWPDYVPALTNFGYNQMADLAWYANMTNEFQLLFIQTWVDFCSRALFAITLLLCLDDVKFLAGDSYSMINRPLKAKTESRRASRNRRVELYAHVALVAWGCLIVAFHSEAAFDTRSPDCVVQARPWLTAKPACTYLLVDCQKYSGMVGAAEDIEAKWAGQDPKFLSFLSFNNCPKLSVPASIDIFTNLFAIYFLNDTLDEWPEHAAITKQHHPNLRFVGLVQVDMTKFGSGKSLPAGLTSHDFPPTVKIIFICLSGLIDLPTDIDQSWPPGTSLMLPLNAFTTVPDVLLRLKPIRVVLHSNPLRELPAALFESESLKTIELQAAPFTHFPQAVSLSPVLRRITMQFSQAEALPDWMLTDKFASQVRVIAGGTPYCAQLQNQSQSGESDKLLTRFCAFN